MTSKSPSSPSTKIWVGYARSSSSEQALNSHKLEQQIKRLENAGAAVVIFDIQSDQKDKRPELMTILAMIKNGEVSE